MADWSDLTNDVLEYIARLLSFPDHCRFSAVCRNWRSVSKWRRYPPAPQLPWLVLDEESDTRKRKFYSLSESKHYSIDIPELHGRYICGSSHGWLFAVDIKITGILINPFTRECYELPPFPAFSENTNVTTLIEKVPSDYIEGPRDYTFKEMQTLVVFKAILSHDPKERSDFTAMILFGQKNSPAFWRPGDSSWTLMVNCPTYRMEDVLYFKGNFYVVSSMNVVHVVDFVPEPKLTVVGPEIWEGCVALQKYLVDFNGSMLLIQRFCEEAPENKSNTVDFDVIKPNLEKNCFYYWDDMDDCALFLSRNSSIFVHSNDFSMCKKNSIYFTHLTQSFSADEFGCHDLGIYDMIDEKISPFFSLEVFPPKVGSPVWITPNPW
ncbi:hypothetical protein LUZ63_015253 [Rhynchospora breviuscula]|uniref:F-box domain-containing protein n=1 Tax=Rhynchospora breviuscula TaxID=2022672 RepID=A0A9Q0CBY8_9POAL|nr:hypothetical protein LUZ63_015253 [Rhynchospora breviuscula]